VALCYNYIMAKSVFERSTISFVDGTEVELGPLKIAFLRKFMDVFNLIDFVNNDDQAITVLTECATICMRQYYPLISTRGQLEDLADLKTVYKILELCAGIKIDPNKENVDDQAKKEKDKNSTKWEDLDLAKLEAEAFQLGIWKNFDDLEHSISMPELVAILESISESRYQNQKFLAAMQGVDLDKGNKQDEWEKMKARVFSGNQTENPDDILTFQGHKAQQAGFGLGMGLDYVNLKKKDS
jgi:hypothetical protein